MELEPLKQFVCDDCRAIIEKIEDGWFEWYDNPIHGFRIVHVQNASPVQSRCYYPRGTSVSDMHLDYFTGLNGLAFLLSFFSRNLANPNEVAEIIRRLHLPHYEEARQYLTAAHADGFLDPREPGAYSQEELIRVIDSYRNRNDT